MGAITLYWWCLVLFHVKWCIRQLCCCFIISCNVTSIVHDHHTDIYSQTYTSTCSQVWEECNQAFDRLALAAVIDQDIFCIHGGIPRPIDDFTNEIQAIMAVPNVAGKSKSVYFSILLTSCVI